MPRNMSFSATVHAMRSQQKTVTRRKGWRFLKVGDVLNAVEKSMGLKKGQKVKRIGQIRVVDVSRLPVWDITRDDLDAEGFPELRLRAFVVMYCDMNKCTSFDKCTRIEFEHI